MLRITGGWIIITIGRTAAWAIWPQRHSWRSVLRKAQLYLGVESALNRKSQFKLKDEKDEKICLRTYFGYSCYRLQ